jgi:hypothetical protein
MEKMDKRRTIYNLEFPYKRKTIKIGRFLFSRVEEYPNKILELQHRVNAFSEFDVVFNDGTNEITSYVEIDPEKFNNWDKIEKKELNNILLLLSLFTCRDVFAGTWGYLEHEKLIALDYDSRIFGWGGVLLCSVPNTMEGEGGEMKNVGKEKHINEVYDLISSSNWSNKYNNGEFLFLAKNAFQQQSIESAFTQCWTIWEHLYYVFNITSKSENEIRNTNSREKIACLLEKFEIVDLVNNYVYSHIDGFKDIRNRLIHFGKFPEKDGVRSDAILFIQITEVIIAKILNLEPSNVLNTLDKVEEIRKKSL